MREITQKLQRIWSECMADSAFRKKIEKQDADVTRRRAQLEKLSTKEEQQ